MDCKNVHQYFLIVAAAAAKVAEKSGECDTLKSAATKSQKTRDFQAVATKATEVAAALDEFERAWYERGKKRGPKPRAKGAGAGPVALVS